MNAIPSEKPEISETPESDPNLAAVNDVEAGIRDFVRSDVAYLRRPGQTASLTDTVADSDAAVKDSLTGVFGRSLDEFLVPTDIVRHIVVTVDNLMRRKASVQMWPLQPTPGQPVVAGADEQLTLSEDNFARYEPIMKMVRSTDVRQVAAVYKHFYPLFQQVYADLGYPNGYFNNRLVEVIDNLLETPEVHGPIRLVQPGVLYQFADPALEDRSAGQKLLIRMGSSNTAEIKLKLRELRSEIAR